MTLAAEKTTKPLCIDVASMADAADDRTVESVMTIVGFNVREPRVMDEPDEETVDEATSMLNEDIDAPSFRLLPPAAKMALPAVTVMLMPLMAEAGETDKASPLFAVTDDAVTSIETVVCDPRKIKPVVPATHCEEANVSENEDIAPATETQLPPEMDDVEKSH